MLTRHEKYIGASPDGAGMKVPGGRIPASYRIETVEKRTPPKDPWANVRKRS